MRELLTRAQRVVIKIGSRLLRDAPLARPAAIADEIAALRASRRLEAVVVSSGAIALGLRALGLAQRPTELPGLQAAAAVGQNALMQNWERAFGAHRILVGQVLLTHDDVRNRTRFLAARNAIRTLLDHGVVPIINENDAVSVEEIKFGDNDQLAALACNLVSADALVILTDVDGLLDAEPAAGGRRIPLVEDIDEDVVRVAGGAVKGGVGTGGMASKVQAARIAGRSGLPTVVAPGRRPGVLAQVLAGEDVGTLFLPSPARLASRKHWIAFANRPSGAVVVDDGAKRALVEKRKSLLPSGVREVRGKFAIGEAISVLDVTGAEFARGLAGYASDEVEKIRGRRSADIEAILGYKYLDEVIHADDLVIL